MRATTIIWAIALALSCSAQSEQNPKTPTPTPSERPAPAIPMKKEDPALKLNSTINLIEVACEQGLLHMCDELLILVQLCRADRPEGEACQSLNSALEPPSPGSDKRAVSIVAPFEGCYRASQEISRKTECVPSAEQGAPSVELPFFCSHSAWVSIGTVVCLESDRVFVQRQEFKPVAWDIERAMWKAGEKALEYQLIRDSAFPNMWMNFVVRKTSERTIVMDYLGESVEFTRLSEAEEKQAQSEIEALPSRDRVCARARQCEDTIRRLLTAPGQSPFKALPPSTNTNLLGCIALSRNAVTRLQQQMGASVSIPGDCR